MKLLQTTILALPISFLSLFPTFHTRICYGSNPSSEIVNNVYSSVVLITHNKIKTSVWDALRFAAFVAGTVTGTGSVGIGSVVPGHLEKQVGTGFQTKWGIVTNSHVMDNKPKAVLTTFHKTNYSIKNINRIQRKDKNIPVYNVTILDTTSKEAVTYDWGDIGVDLALIRVKIPGAFALSLAKEVNEGEKVFTLGHPDAKEFTPAIGSINRIYHRGKVKYIELFIESAPGSSGSPVLNMKGEVVGIIRGGIEDLGVSEAVHVDELREIFGLTRYRMSKIDSSQTMPPWSGAVYSTRYSRVFHRPDCNELSSHSDDLILFLSKEDAIRNGGISCSECNP